MAGFGALLYIWLGSHGSTRGGGLPAGAGERRRPRRAGGQCSWAAVRAASPSLFAAGSSVPWQGQPIWRGARSSHADPLHVQRAPAVVPIIFSTGWLQQVSVRSRRRLRWRRRLARELHASQRGGNWSHTQLCGCRVQSAHRCLSLRARMGLNRPWISLPLRFRCSSWLWSSSFNFDGSHGYGCTRRQFWVKISVQLMHRLATVASSEVAPVAGGIVEEPPYYLNHEFSFSR
jgi:hypothetical protein